MDSAHAPAFMNANGLRTAFLAYNDVDWPGCTAVPGCAGLSAAMDAPSTMTGETLAIP